MHLEYEAERFIDQNCTACSHHDELSNENLGRDILARRLRMQQEATLAEQRRRELERQTQQEATSALQTKEMTHASVNQLILRFHNPEQATDVIQSLKDAAKIAPEFFSDDALKVLVDGFTTALGEACVEIVRSVLLNRKDLSAFMQKAAVDAVHAGLDTACSIIVDHFSDFERTALLEALASALNIPEYEYVPSSSFIRTRPKYPGTVSFVLRMLETAPNEVRSLIGQRLGFDNKRSKLNCANILFDLLPHAAEQVVPLTRMLVRSLELADDGYGDSADEAVCEVLAHLYAFSSAHVEEELGRIYALVSGELRRLILDIYASIAMHGAEDGNRRVGQLFPRTDYAAHVPAIIDKLYIAISDMQNEMDVRTHASELLENVVAAYPEHGASKLHRFLTRLALTTREAKAAPVREGSPLAHLDNISQSASYDAIENRVIGIVKRIAEHSPAPTFEAVVAAIGETDSKLDPNLKSKLVSTLATFGKQYAMVPVVLPELYKHLTDFGSNFVRQSAIDVVGELMQIDDFTVPDNMIELVSTYLGEDFVVIHKSAVRAFRYYHFSPDDDRGKEVLRKILAIERAYSAEGNERVDTDFLRDLVAVLNNAYRDWPDVQDYVTTTLLPKYGAMQNRHFAEDMLVAMSRRVRTHVAAQRSYLISAIVYLSRFSRDRYNNSLTSDRSRIFESLFDLPSSLVADASAAILGMIRSHVGRDGYEALCFIGLLSYHELHAAAALVAKECAQRLPQVKEHEVERGLYELAATAERTEAERIVDRRTSGSDK
ncbi:hypothetical protein ACSRUE_36310 [Sorangium sp. KYC3313]|uniref:hypothetical protein n=1 Tax=Sorangium sp. KYC3313 TaxID=3449740 RepID=UPI003F8C4632